MLSPSGRNVQKPPVLRRSLRLTAQQVQVATLTTAAGTSTNPQPPTPSRALPLQFPEKDISCNETMDGFESPPRNCNRPQSASTSPPVQLRFARALFGQVDTASSSTTSGAVDASATAKENTTSAIKGEDAPATPVQPKPQLPEPPTPRRMPKAAKKATPRNQPRIFPRVQRSPRQSRQQFDLRDKVHKIESAHRRRSIEARRSTMDAAIPTPAPSRAPTPAFTATPSTSAIGGFHFSPFEGGHSELDGAWPTATYSAAPSTPMPSRPQSRANSWVDASVDLWQVSTSLLLAGDPISVIESRGLAHPFGASRTDYFAPTEPIAFDQDVSSVDDAVAGTSGPDAYFGVGSGASVFLDGLAYGRDHAWAGDPLRAGVESEGQTALQTAMTELLPVDMLSGLPNDGLGEPYTYDESEFV